MLYALLGFCHVGYEELVPLWVLTDRPKGGFAFDAAQIGTAMAFTGVPLLRFMCMADLQPLKACADLPR